MAEYCQRNEPDLTQCGRIRPCEHHEPHAHAYVEARREERADVVAFTAFHLAQLRHLYGHMINGRITNQQEAARGLLGPAIECFEGIERGEHVGAAQKRSGR